MPFVLFYDTETSGLPLCHEPSGDPGQPHIVQLAADLVDVDKPTDIIASIDFTVRPKDWAFEEDAVEKHGITEEMAYARGIEEKAATDAFFALWELSTFRVGHNESFDARIVRIATKRYYDDELVNRWKAGRAECTQKLATPIVKAPPSDKMLEAGMKHSKTANLAEAYEHFHGEPMVDAHTAIADMRACRDVWFAIRAAGP